MPSDFNYMTSSKNLKSIMQKIQTAGAPPKFSIEFLKSLGFTSSADRPAIGVLKALGFISADGTPTPRYNDYRNLAKSGSTLATGLRDGWADLFLVDTSAHARNATELTELFKSASGKGEAVARKMATTFRALADLAKWTGNKESEELDGDPADGSGDERDRDDSTSGGGRAGMLRLHHDVHIHLPTTSDVTVYTAIFRAIKAELSD